MSVYEVQKGVPIPSKGKGSGLSALIRGMDYGDCTTIPAGQHLGVHTCARSVGAKVKTKSNPDGTVTVWRVDQGSSNPATAGPSNSLRTTPVGSGSNPNPRSDPRSNPSLSPGSAASKPDLDVRTSAHFDVFLTPDGDLPTGHYEQRHPWGPNIWVNDLDAQGRPENRNKNKQATTTTTAPGADIFS